jgi:hypothetical protein
MPIPAFLLAAGAAASRVASGALAFGARAARWGAGKVFNPSAATQSHGSFSNRIANRLWAISSGSQVAELVESTLPSWIREIEVQVSGGPGARIERIWQLCVAAAFGKLVEGPGGEQKTTTQQVTNIQLEGQWDLTDKVVAMRIVASRSGIGESWTPAATRDADNPLLRTGLPQSYFLLGPRQEIVGSLYSPITGIKEFKTATRKVVGGWPEGRSSAATPNQTITDKPLNELPDRNRLILGSYKYDELFQNPRPELDELSRGSTVSLVCASLMNQPGYLPVKPPAALIDKGYGHPKYRFVGPTVDPGPSIDDWADRLGRPVIPAIADRDRDGYRPLIPTDKPGTNAPNLGPVQDNDTAKFGLRADLRGSGS